MIYGRQFIRSKMIKLKKTTDLSRFVMFCQYPQVLPFIVTECMLSDSIKKAAVIPVFVKLFRCTCKPAESSLVWMRGNPVRCQSCEAEEHVLCRSTPGVFHEILSDYSLPDDVKAVEEKLTTLTVANFKEFCFENIAVGRIALYDVILEYKLFNSNFDPESDVWRKYTDLVRICMLTALWTKRLLRANEIIGLSVYNSYYSVNRIACMVTQYIGIPWFTMHGGGSLKYRWDALILTHKNIDNHRIACSVNWKTHCADRILRSEEVKKIGEHFEMLFAGTLAHAYSAPVGSANCDNLLAAINPSGKRKLLLLTLSSPDEVVALTETGIYSVYGSEHYAFSSQTDWLKFLISQVKDRDDLGMIIRVHPRDFPNKREGRMSANAIRLKDLLVNLPSNVVVNWPTDNISFYDLLQKIDLVLTAWSTVLQEASLFGCPVILPKNPNNVYEAIADAVCGDPESYWMAVLDYLDREWTLTRAVKTFRWYWNQQFESNVYLNSRVHRQRRFNERAEDAIGTICVALEKWGIRLPGYFSRSMKAFAGHGKQISERRIDFPGEIVVQKTFLEGYDPMADFQDLQERQGLSAPVFSPDAIAQETRDVLAEINRLVSIVQSPSVAPTTGGKIHAMIRSREKIQDS
ncbi:MAG: hypothetical protein ABI615_05060 [Chthoniobacterales bacterium]